MTSTTLQALRRLLFFSVPEAAIWIPVSGDRPQGVTERSWRLWENGRRPVPQDVTTKIIELCEWREQAIQAAVAQISQGRAALDEHNERVPIALAWYETVEDWCSVKGRAPVLWRPQCSVIAEVIARYGAVAVAFDPAAYAAWRGKRADTEVLRGAWAAARASSGK